MRKKRGVYKRRRVHLPRGGWMIDDCVVIERKRPKLVKGVEKLKLKPPHPLQWSSYMLVEDEGQKQWYMVRCESDERFDRQFLGIRPALSYWSFLKSLEWKASIVLCDAQGRRESWGLRRLAAGARASVDE